MAKFEISPEASLTEAEVKMLQEAFAALSERVEKVKQLEKSAKEYFSELYALGRDMEELHKYAEDFTVDGHEIWIDRDNYYNAGRAVGRFWVPSSMTC